MQGFVLFPGIEEARGEEGKNVWGNTGEMPLDEICCCFPKIPRLKAESISVAI